PFPRWNCWVKDPLLARSLANEIELFLAPNSKPEAISGHSTSPPAPPPLWFVAHSNGAEIALLAAKCLIGRGHKIAGLIFTGAACEADVRINGVLEWQSRGLLGAAIPSSSAEDAVLSGDAR